MKLIFLSFSTRAACEEKENSSSLLTSSGDCHTSET